MKQTKRNVVALILKIVAFATWGMGIIISAVIWGSTPVIYTVNTSLILSTLVVSAVAGFMIFAFGEIISLLHKIACNTENS